ncbi:MAG: hypothetical protein RLZZ561_212 [Pseudomonadota bacterium]|jgi:mannose-6-phosphate isomerase
MAFIKLPRQVVAKPWGRSDIPACFDVGKGKIGEVWFDSPDQVLPILVKWLFTSERLSIQVHPDDLQAKAVGLTGGKEECWIITEAQPGATLGIGTREPLSKKSLHDAALSGEIEGLMDWIDVAPGDWFHIPPGTVHAIGAGVTLVEIQQNVDVTFRLYDYGRPRALHLDSGVSVSAAQPHPDHLKGRLDPLADIELVTSCDHFKIYHGHGAGFGGISGDPFWLIPIAGSIETSSGPVGVGDVLYGTHSSEINASSDFSFLAATR